MSNEFLYFEAENKTLKGSIIAKPNTATAKNFSFENEMYSRSPTKKVNKLTATKVELNLSFYSKGVFHIC